MNKIKTQSVKSKMMYFFIVVILTIMRSYDWDPDIGDWHFGHIDTTESF